MKQVFFFWKPLTELCILDAKNKKYPLVFLTTQSKI